jgi:tetratricopeptide (TPR) repeat protein
MPKLRRREPRRRRRPSVSGRAAPESVDLGSVVAGTIAAAESMDREASEALRRAFEQQAASDDPNVQAESFYQLGLLAQEDLELDRSTAFLTRTIAAGHPWWTPKARLELARNDLVLERVPEAIEKLREVAEDEHPEASPAAWLQLAEHWDSEGDELQAASALRGAEAALRGAIQWSTHAEDEDTKAIGRDARMRLAALDLQLERSEEAASLYREVAEMNERDALGRSAVSRLADLDPDWRPPSLRAEEAERKIPREQRPTQRVASDAWTEEDRLDRAIYADALADFILDTGTRAPLSIGIYGPWGSGKSSLMRMLRRRIDPQGAGGMDRYADASGGARGLRTRQVLRLLDASAPPFAQGAMPAAASASVRKTVWFNAWMYQSRDEVWAGLAHALLTQTTASLPPRAREAFWLHLNVRRARPDRIRAGMHRWLLAKLLPSFLVAVAALVLGGVLALTDVLVPVVGWLGGIGLGVVVVASSTARRLARPAEGVLEDVLEIPDYSPTAMSYAAVTEDVKRMVELVASPEEPLVVFIDDLDRCSAGTVAELVEAMNLFIGGEIPNCLFVIGVDPRIVAATLETAYSDLERAEAQMRSASEPSVGWRFVEKLVQLPLRVPVASPAQMERYVSSLLLDPVRHQLTSVRVPVPEDSVRVETSDDVASGLSTPVARLEAGMKILRREQETIIEFRDDTPGTRALLARYAPLLQGNPRDVKRFLNLFRMFSSLAVRRDLRGLRVDDGGGPSDLANELECLAKLSVLCVRWPHLVDLLCREVQWREDLRSILSILEHSWEVFGLNRSRLISDAEVAALEGKYGPKNVLTSGPPIAAVAAVYL